ncbi:MAG: GTP-binding protein [Steroidobacteraceae bacterium]
MSLPATSPIPIPVNIITGSLGAGKTTAIARLLADKPAHETWVVILNEFTDTGIDTLTLAAAARGAYDLRMIPGGCLCCTGEEDFRQQLSALLARPPSQWPARIVIEPSGIAHPGVIVEELRGFERSGALRLMSTVALLDAQSWSDAGLTTVMREQVDAADVVLLSKAELVDDERHRQFMQWAEQLFPSKRYVGLSARSALPELALSPPAAAFAFELSPMTERSGVHRHVHAPVVSAETLQWGTQLVLVRMQTLLEREACGWMIPTTLLFDLHALQALLADESGRWQGVERFKAILRTGVEQWHLLQRWGKYSSFEICAWRQDSRIEVQLEPGVKSNWPEWHVGWQVMSETCPVA